MRQETKARILAEMKKGYWFTKKYLAEKLQVDVRAVSKALSEGLEEKEIRIVKVDKGQYLVKEYTIEANIFFKEMTSIEEDCGAIKVKGTSEELIFVKDEYGKPKIVKKLVPMSLTVSKLALQEIAEAIKSEVPFF